MLYGSIERKSVNEVTMYLDCVIAVVYNFFTVGGHLNETANGYRKPMAVIDGQPRRLILLINNHAIFANRCESHHVLSKHGRNAFLNRLGFNTFAFGI
jgi:hypothetical protein